MAASNLGQLRARHERRGGAATRDSAMLVRSVSRICAHLFIVYVTYIIDKCAQMRETERTFGF